VLIIIPFLVNILTFIIIKSHISTISHKNDKINYNVKSASSKLQY
jgi:hypothetical protein